jgi:hypothetical protein
MNNRLNHLRELIDDTRVDNATLSQLEALAAIAEELHRLNEQIGPLAAIFAEAYAAPAQAAEAGAAPPAAKRSVKK